MDTDPTPAPASRPPVLPHVLRLDLLGDDEPLRQARRFVRLQAEQLGLEGRRRRRGPGHRRTARRSRRRVQPHRPARGGAAGALVVGVDVRFADGRTRPVLSGHTRDLLRQLSGETGWSPTDDGAQLWCRVP